MQKKILVADDNRIMLTFMTELLEREGHQVVTAKDGFSALNILVSFVPDILFIDLFMPKIEGDKLCQIVRNMPHLKNCYLVIISAAVAEMEFDYAGIGADRCIAKGPFDKMAEHVLAAVKASDSVLQQEESKQVLGLEDVHVRQMTKELISRNRHLEAILDSIDEAVLEVSHGILIYANKAAVSLFGISQAELLARYFIKLFDPGDHERVKALLRPGSGENTDITPDNPVVLNGRQLTIKSYSMRGKAASSIFLLTDITRQNRMQFAHYHDRKMEAVRSAVGRIAKDIRKQLEKNRQVIADTLKEMDADNPSLTKITQVDRHLRGLIRQLSVSAGKKEFKTENKAGQVLRGSERILLTDGDMITRQMNRLVLEEIGYKVMTAGSGRETIDKYRIRFDKTYNKIDLVIVNTMLPDMPSDELCDCLKKINPKVKVLLAGEDEPDFQKAPKLNQTAGSVRKSFDINKMSLKLRKMLDGV